MPKPKSGDPFVWLTPHGENAQRIRSFDWSKSPLGPVETWPQSLKTTINTCLASKTPMHLWWGPEHINIYNDAYIPIIGSKRHPRFFARPANEMWPEIWETLNGLITQVHQNGVSIFNENFRATLERDGRTEDGYFSFSFNPVLNEEGKIAGELAIIMETTENIQANALMKSEREKFYSLLMQAPLPMCVLEGPDHRFTIVNPKYLKMVGREVQGKPVREVFSQAEAGNFFELLDEVYRTGKPYQGTELSATLEGPDQILRQRYLSVGFHAFFSPQGNIQGIIAIHQDVTELVRSRKAVENERENFRNLFKQTPEMVCIVTGPNHVFEFVNEAHIRALGFDATGMAVRVAQPESVEVHGILDNVYRTGVTAELHEIPVTLTDRLRYFNLTYSARRDENGTINGIMILGVEVTDQVLSRRTLALSKDQAQEAIRSRDEFLSIASHELKTPLTSLKLQAHMFNRSALKNPSSLRTPEKLAEVMAMMDRGLNRISRLVDDMLDISRIRNGKLTLQSEKLDIAEVIHDAMGRLHAELAGAGIELRLHLETGLLAHLDRFRFEQVLTNLATNAIRYAPKAPVDITLRKEGSLAQIRFQDHGPGISEADLDKVFLQFERLISANEISGLGLGLFICRQIIEGHGGKIHVESKLGKGAAFVIEIPLA